MELEAELREFYMEVDWGKSYFTFGKQQVVWGKAGRLKVLDVVNSQSFRELYLEDFDNSRYRCEWPMSNAQSVTGECTAIDFLSRKIFSPKLKKEKRRGHHIE